jgi:membrane protease YdiL (CAAX protease family)
MSHSEPSRRPVHDSWRQLALFAAAAFGWTWGIAAVIAVLDPDTTGVALLFAIAVFGPSVTGVLLTARFEGRSGVVGLWRGATRWRVQTRWYAVVLLVLPAMIVLGGAVRSSQTGDALLAAAPSMWPLIILGTLALGPLGEELGWRGFALPRLLDLMPTLPASLLLGVVWWAWHLPAFWLAVPPFDTLSPLPHLLSAVLMTVVMTGVYLRTGRSVLLSGIAVHTVVNASLAIVHVSLWTLVAALALAALLVVAMTRSVWRSRRAAPTEAASARAGAR